MNNELTMLNDERWCVDCGNFVMPISEIDVDETTGTETTFINCPNCGKNFQIL